MTYSCLIFPVPLKLISPLLESWAGAYDTGIDVNLSFFLLLKHTQFRQMQNINSLFSLLLKTTIFNIHRLKTILKAYNKNVLHCFVSEYFAHFRNLNTQYATLCMWSKCSRFLIAEYLDSNIVDYFMLWMIFALDCS